ncbi:MAG: flagellar biosynthesis protein FlhB [Burkholderiaceae bacterium]
MSENSDQDRELPASERRIQQARDEGNIPRSRELSGGAILLGTVVLFNGMSESLVGNGLGLMRGGLTLTRDDAFDSKLMGLRLIALLSESLWWLLPIFALTILLALACNLVVGGFIVSGKMLTPDFSKLNPAKGLKNIFSLNGLAELVKALVKTLLLGYMGYWLIKRHLPEFAQMMGLPLTVAIERSIRITIDDALWLAAIFFVLVTFDVPYQLWRYYHGMRMTLEELKRESKESDGDPHLKARIRSLQREAARKRMMSAIPKADVVVTNPTHFSVALSYAEGGNGAPTVVAKGRGEIALKIREIATGHKVPIVEMPPLARALYTHVELEDEVPASLYLAVAKLLAHVYALRSGMEALTPIPDTSDIPAGLDPGVPED